MIRVLVTQGITEVMSPASWREVLSHGSSWNAGADSERWNDAMTSFRLLQNPHVLVSIPFILC
jgi:hypothetical protein